METYRCWLVFEGSSPDDGTDVTEASARDAAESYAHRLADKDAPADFDGLVGTVGPNGTRRFYSIYVEWCPETTIERVPNDEVRDDYGAEMVGEASS
jgi:hypothetical protein